MKKKFGLGKINAFTININKILKKYVIILRKAYTSQGVSGIKFFLNLKNFNAMQSQIRKVIVNDKEVTDPNKIQNEIRHRDSKSSS